MGDRLKEGRPGVQRVLLALGRLVAECQRRTSPGAAPVMPDAWPEAWLGRTLAEAEAVRSDLAEADLVKQSARAALAEADAALGARFDDARLALARMKARIEGQYGHDPQQLAAFGLGVPRWARRPRKTATTKE